MPLLRTQAVGDAFKARDKMRARHHGETSSKVIQLGLLNNSSSSTSLAKTPLVKNSKLVSSGSTNDLSSQLDDITNFGLSIE